MRSGAIFAFLVPVLISGTSVNDPLVSGKVTNARQRQEPPCYVLISDRLSSDGKARDLTILVDKDDVNEGNFVRLQLRFSAEYPQPRNLTVFVHTSLRFTLGQYSTVDNLQRQDAGLPANPTISEKDAQGILMRGDAFEKFCYKVEGGDPSDMKCVLLRGHDSACRDCKQLDAGDPDVRDEHRAGHAGGGPLKGRLSCHFQFANVVNNNLREIGLFINSRDGSGANLVELLRNYARQYPQPDRLHVRLYSDLKQSYHFGIHDLGEYVVPAMAQHFAAVLFRDGGNSVIRFRHPGEEVQTVVVNGIDVFPGLDD